MDFLTTSQIEDFNNPLAFARSRTARVSQSELSTATSRTVRTGDIEESYRLVLGAASRLETLEGNLTTMLGLSEQGARARGDERKINEFYGKIRSLSAGFDQVVEAIRFNGQSIFTDRPIALNMGTGVRELDLDPIRLLTYGEGGLNLSEAVGSADVRISYSIGDQIVNDGYDVIGLDLSDASFISGSNPALEMENGTYRVEIEYAGADSKVSILTQEGGLVEEKTGVDLSGSGIEWVDFDVGVRLSFEMESLFQSFDKYDFEANGPAKLQATLSYERIDRHVVRTSEEPPGVEKAEFLYDSVLSMGGGTLTLTEPRVSAVETDKIALETGNYNLQVEYRGEDSVIRLTDSFGRLHAYEYGIDLSAQRDQSIDLGNGLSFTINNDNFTEEGATFNAVIDYQAEERSIDQFDFTEYKKRIEEAILIVQEQTAIIAKTQAEIERLNQVRNSALTSAAPNTGTLAASGAATIISGGGAGGLFGAISPEARFGVLSKQLFNTTNAFPSQANQSPEALSQLSLAGNSSSILSTFA